MFFFCCFTLGKHIKLNKILACFNNKSYITFAGYHKTCTRSLAWVFLLHFPWRYYVSGETWLKIVRTTFLIYKANIRYFTLLLLCEKINWFGFRMKFQPNAIWHISVVCFNLENSHRNCETEFYIEIQLPEYQWKRKTFAINLKDTGWFSFLCACSQNSFDCVSGQYENS